MTHANRRKTKSRQNARGVWVVLAGGGAFACLIAGIAVQVTGTAPWRGASATVDQVSVSDEETRTGSILLVPFSGDQCQQNLFDNRTGRIWRSGYVSCDVALFKTKPDSGKNWSMARTEAIRDGFRWK